jgi:zinc D-Ala-D-Ala carboxypeptidase
MEIISLHISYSEATNSTEAKRLGIDNTPNSQQLNNMVHVATKVFEPIREHFGVRIYISSFFRSKALNVAIGGAVNSQHVTGEAIDIDADQYGLISNKQIFDYIKDSLEFDQLIWEEGTDLNPDWVHVSYTTSKPNRHQILIIKTKDGKKTTREYSVRDDVQL